MRQLLDGLGQRLGFAAELSGALTFLLQRALQHLAEIRGLRLFESNAMFNAMFTPAAVKQPSRRFAREVASRGRALPALRVQRPAWRPTA